MAILIVCTSFTLNTNDKIHGGVCIQQVQKLHTLYPLFMSKATSLEMNSSHVVGRGPSLVQWTHNMYTLDILCLGHAYSCNNSADLLGTSQHWSRLLQEVMLTFLARLTYPCPYVEGFWNSFADLEAGQKGILGGVKKD